MEGRPAMTGRIHAAAGHGFGPLQPDGVEMVVGIVVFMVILAVLGQVLLPRLEQQFEERADTIDGGLQRAHDTEARALLAREEYRAVLAEARHEAAGWGDHRGLGGREFWGRRRT
jgi:F-type H+-transporting ATPase subunit b